MAFVFGSSGKADFDKIREIKAEAERVELERQKHIKAQFDESEKLLQQKKAFNARLEAPPPAEIKPGQVDVNAITPGMSHDAKAIARAAIERQLIKFNNR